MMPLFLENTTADGGRLAASDTSTTLADIGPIPADAIVVLPVRNMVMFPGIVVPIAIGRERSVAAAQYAVKMELPIGILMQHNPEAQTPEAADLSSIGTLASILRYVTTPDFEQPIFSSFSIKEGNAASEEEVPNTMSNSFLI